MSYQYISKTLCRYARPLSQSLITIAGFSIHTLCCAHIADQEGSAIKQNSTQDQDHIEQNSGNAFQGHFSSVIDAVTDASNRFNPDSIAQDREYMGAVLRQKDASELGNIYTYTVTQGKTGSETVTIKFSLPKHMEIVAFWHTHGKAHWSRRYFSDVDTSVANTWGVPFYLADYTGKLKVYEPGAKLLSPFKAQKMGLGKQSGYAKGRVVHNTETGLYYRINTVQHHIAGIPAKTQRAHLPI